MIDIICISILVIMMIIGYNRGFIWQVLRLARMLLLLILLYVFGNYVIAFFLPIINPWAESLFFKSVPDTFRTQVSTLAIRLLFPIVFYLVIRLVTGKLLVVFQGKVIKKIPLVGTLNSILGSGIALIEYIVLFLLFVALMPLVGHELNTYIIDNSYIIRFVQDHLPSIIKIIQMYWS